MSSFFGSSCQVQDPKIGKILEIGHKIGRLFELIHLCLPSKSPPSYRFAASASSTASLSLWHSWLGYIFASQLKSLASGGHLDRSCQNDDVDCLPFQTPYLTLDA